MRKARFFVFKRTFSGKNPAHPRKNASGATMNTTMIKYALLVSLIVSLTACAPEKSNDKKGMAGIWRVVFNDSLYSEIVVSPKKIYSEKGNRGEVLIVSKTLFYYSPDDLLGNSLLAYQRTGDSLLLFQDQLRVGALRVAMLKDNEMDLAGPSIKLHLIRIPREKQAMADILKIDTLRWDHPNFERYLKGYRDRKQEFELQNARR